MVVDTAVVDNEGRGILLNRIECWRVNESFTIPLYFERSGVNIACSLG